MSACSTTLVAAGARLAVLGSGDAALEGALLAAAARAPRQASASSSAMTRRCRI